ncbi:hypothetical protein K469DRAFT_714757 [Zopfia rhizophila CBS 207.26]|uniref:Uncharacterized protein n=1 Tax=Zopfia rhizophila CBS 207.26 TaxID=1314779 RepID=A0A6A6DRV8_9PEZI|nr:hypothetical protein K469DRAFT_714757 [Zopfia rhizophila CBS 207.26]
MDSERNIKNIPKTCNTESSMDEHPGMTDDLWSEPYYSNKHYFHIQISESVQNVENTSQNEKLYAFKVSHGSSIPEFGSTGTGLFAPPNDTKHQPVERQLLNSTLYVCLGVLCSIVVPFSRTCMSDVGLGTTKAVAHT